MLTQKQKPNMVKHNKQPILQEKNGKLKKFQDVPPLENKQTQTQKIPN